MSSLPNSQNGQQTNGPMSNGSGQDTMPIFSITPQIGTSSQGQSIQISTSGGGTSTAPDNILLPTQPPLSDFLNQLEDYTPTIPDAVTKYYLSTSGFETSDPRVLRLVSLAAQKFVSDIANDALQHCKMRGAAQVSKTKGKDRKLVMTTDDLSQALSEQGVTLKKPPYFT